MSLEYKSFSAKFFENEDKGKFEGYASTFGNVDRTNDLIERGAFRKTVEALQGKIKVLENHDYNKRVGLARIEEDEHGLKVFDGKLNLEKQAVKDLYSDMKFGLVDEFSVGFFIKDYSYDDKIRVIKEIELMEVSLVTIPANAEAKLTYVKNLDTIKTLKDAEACLREVGFSHSKAKHLISVIKGLRDVKPEAEIDEEYEILKLLEKKLNV